MAGSGAGAELLAGKRPRDAAEVAKVAVYVVQVEVDRDGLRPLWEDKATVSVPARSKAPGDLGGGAGCRGRVSGDGADLGCGGGAGAGGRAW